MNETKSRTGRKVAVLGPIPRDQVVTHAGERFEKYGCALYTAAALSALLDAGDTVVPIAHVRRQDEGPIKQILESFPNIDLSGITSHGLRAGLRVGPVLGAPVLDPLPRAPSAPEPGQHAVRPPVDTFHAGHGTPHRPQGEPHVELIQVRI
jgi:hypothetical protein